MKSVLIVDDMALIRAPIAAALEAAGLRALTAEHGQQALALLRTERPDLMLLDLTMPGMDGLSVLRAIRKNPATAELAVILLTGSSEKHLVLEAATLGVRDYLLKSNSMMTDVVARVQKCLSAPPHSAAHSHAAKAARSTAAWSKTARKAKAGTAAGKAGGAAAGADAGSSADDPVNLAIKAAVTGVPLLSRQETERRIERAEVRMLPRAVNELMALVSSGTGSVPDALEFLQRDPVLFARLIRVANSAAMACQKPRITTLEEAIGHFGVGIVQNLIAAVGVFEVTADRASSAGPQLLWHHCLAVAALMEKFAPQPEIAPGFAYLIGLCHELPEAMLRHHFPKHYRHAMNLARRTGQPHELLKAEIFGMPYAELADLLLDRLKLPPPVAEPISEFYAGLWPHHLDENDSKLSRLLSSANAYSHGLLLAPGLEETIHPVSAADYRLAFAQAPAVDPVMLRLEVATAASRLAETSTSGNGQAIELMVPKLPIRIAYVRDEEYAAFDPLLAMLQTIGESVTVHAGLAPLPDNFSQVDAVVIAAPRAAHSAELISLVHCVVSACPTRPVPVLCTGGGEFARTGNPLTEVLPVAAPLTLKVLSEFLRNIAPHAVARAA